MAIIFGQLVNDLNGATCEADQAGSAQSYTTSINDKVLLLVYIAIGAFALNFIYVVTWSVVSQRLAHRLRERYFKILLSQEQSFFDKRHAGEVSSRLNSDIQAVQSGTCEKVGIFIASLSFFVTAYVIAFIKQSKLAGMLISLIPAFLLVAIVGGGFFQKFSTGMSRSIEAASSIASEALSHITVVEAFGAGPRLEKKFSGHMSNARQDGIRKGIVAAFQAGMLYFIAYSANALAFWQGSRMIANLTLGRGDGSTVGEIYTVVFIIVDACVVLGSAAPLLPLFGGASAAFQRLRHDMNHKSSIDGTSDQGAELSSETPPGIDFRDVSFAYPSRPGEPVLRNVNLSFPAGKYTAIVGPSGSGKSTIAGLICRLHDPTDGLILFHSHVLKSLNIQSLRSFISLVQQEASLLDRSILENIALGLVNSPIPSHQQLKAILLGPQLKRISVKTKTLINTAKNPEIDPAMLGLLDLVHHAAKLADADEFVSGLEKGYGTIVGSGGKLVSGGQRQRVALARALVKDPQVLILDEATASLDSASEKRIQLAIDKVATGRTVISIAHRLSTIKNADNIIVLKAGEVVEQGTYPELIAKGGLFAEMASLQAIKTPDHVDELSRSSTKNESTDVSSEKIGNDYVKNVERAERPASETVISPGERQHFSSDPTLTSNQSPLNLVKGMGPFIRPSLPWLVAALFAAVIVGCTFSASGLIFGHTVGALSPCKTTTDRILSLGRLFGGMLFMLAVVEFFANLISWSSFGIVAERLLYTVRVLSFRSLFEQNVEWHQVGDRSPSMLLSIITKDSTALGGFSGSILGTVSSILVNFLVAIILSHIIAWKIAVVCLAMVPILLGSGVMQLRALSRYEERNSIAFAESIGITVEAVNSIKTIATLSLETEVMGTYQRVLESPRKQMITASIYTNFWLAVSNSTGFFVYAFAYWWGSKLITKGEATQQQFFIVLVAMLVSAQLWGQMFTLAPEISRSRASASRILNLIQAGSSTKLGLTTEVISRQGNEKDMEALGESSSNTPSPASRGVSVSFKNVSFSYPTHPDVSILQDINIRIQPGQFCGLVGPSGAGKSTIMNLVQKMYSPSAGSIEIDGTDISDKNFRGDIAVVPQDNALFNGTIKFNVSLGARPNHEATDFEIEEACKLANIHDTIISLREKYDTECGPNGSQLSGGQRQRLTIARALVRRPRLLLLDESTSALDPESEKALQEGLERAVKAYGVTVIAITHRLHTVLKADVIFVLDGGKIIDQGRHHELLVRSESYRSNAQQQMLQ
ncbi:ABC multidrug transporter SitT [Amylocarpus encephaloides]|uniref:ABC multidrug transporter SitT n=1 Tax=Amylocarpus encephaloides TaxID=45428 RepID=A0A9P7YQT1_9HELO|nr:ABC multidrug transporter SitT [Amylocarpus encephaloides]